MASKHDLGAYGGAGVGAMVPMRQVAIAWGGALRSPRRAPTRGDLAGWLRRISRQRRGNCGAAAMTLVRLLGYCLHGMLRRMTSIQRLAAAALIVFTTIAALFTVLVAPGSGALERSSIRAVFDVTSVVLLLAWFAIAAIRPGWFPASRLMPAILACLAAFLISTVTSRVPRMSIEMLGYAVLLAELYLLLVAMMRRAGTRSFLGRLGLALCIALPSLYLVETLSVWQDWWGLVGRLALPPLRPSSVGLAFGSPNPVATLVLTLGAFGLASMPKTPRIGRLLAIAVVCLAGAATIVSGSRGAWLGGVAGAGAAGIAAITVFKPARTRVAAQLRSRRGVAIAAVALSAVAAGGLLAALSGRLTTEGGNFRASFAAASLRMFDSSPLVGVGPGVWQILRASFTAPTDIDYYVPHAHDIYVMTLAEFGLVGILAGLVVAVTVGRLVLHALRSPDSGRQRMGIAVLFVLALFAAQQLVDVLVNVPALLFAAALPIAWLDATGQPTIASEAGAGPALETRVVLRRAVLLGAAALTCVVAAGLIPVETSASAGDQAAAAAESSDWRAAAKFAAQAAGQDPSVNAYWFVSGVAAANAGDLEQAETALARSAAGDDFTYAWLNLAAVRWRLGDSGGARQALTRAERLGLQRTPVALAAGWLRRQLGDLDLANADDATAVAGAPSLAADPYWSSTVSLKSAWPVILQAAEQRVGGDTALELDLFSGQVDAATTLAVGLAASDSRLYPLLVPAWGGDAIARADLTELAESRPLDATPASWCQVIAIHLGDAASARRFSAWLGVLSTSAPVARIVLGVPLPVPNDGIDRYGSLYRRPVPAELVVGILPQLEWQTQP